MVTVWEMYRYVVANGSGGVLSLQYLSDGGTWVDASISAWMADVVCNDCHRGDCKRADCYTAPRPDWMGPEFIASNSAPRRDSLDHGFVDETVNGPGPLQLIEGVDFNRPPEMETTQAALLAAAEREGKVGRPFLASEANAPNPCPACYYAEHGMQHSYTSACKESE